MGQLYALRALCHFDVVRLFAKSPAISDVNAPNSGIPISNEKYPVDFEPARATLKETYDFIIGELNTAVGLLSENENFSNDNEISSDEDENSDSNYVYGLTDS